MDDQARQATPTPVTVEYDDDIAIIVIDNPPVNAGSTLVRAGLLAAMETIAGNSSARGAVLVGAGNTFVAGSDIKEFGKSLQQPELPDVIEAIENCAVPVVAALHGAALGGGFELALGCDGRVASNDALVGLPEVTLGMIPGAGGTQRLPRLVPAAVAIGIVCSGRRILAAEALALGLVDRIIEADLREGAVAFARTLGQQKRVLRHLPAIMSSDTELDEAEKVALKTGRNRPHVKAAVEVIRSALVVPFHTALANERATFQRFRVGCEAAALRHLFFAEREAGKVAGLDGVMPRAISEVAVVGAGTMGIGIATAFLDADFMVILADQDDQSLTRATVQIEKTYARLVAQERLTLDSQTDRLARLSVVTDLAKLARCDLVIEAIFEDMAVKTDLFQTLDAILKPGAVFASNTSYLNLDEIARVTRRPNDVVGLHFFNPANVMRLLEVVRGAATSSEVLATALAIAKRLRKTAIVSGVGEGFIGNRIYAAYRRQCEFMLEEGAYPEDVDRALETFGMAMGPFAVGDMSGLDIAWKMRQRLAATRDPGARYVSIPDALCEMGRFGQKTGAGWYQYPSGQRKGISDPAVHTLVDAASVAKGIHRKPFSASEIVERAVVTMVNEAALLLEEGIAQRASDIDLALVNGYGFPNYEGGPLFWASRQPPEDLTKTLDHIESVSGIAFKRGNIGSVLAAVRAES